MDMTAMPKSKNAYLKKDSDVNKFFTDVSLVPRKDSGVLCKMIELGKSSGGSQVVSL